MKSTDSAVIRMLASHQCSPGSNAGPGVISELSLLLVLILAPRIFRGVSLQISLRMQTYFRMSLGFARNTSAFAG